jgi:hypothetical protein
MASNYRQTILRARRSERLRPSAPVQRPVSTATYQNNFYDRGRFSQTAPHSWRRCVLTHWREARELLNPFWKRPARGRKSARACLLVVPRTDIVASGRRRNNKRIPKHVRNRRPKRSVAAGCGRKERERMSAGGMQCWGLLAEDNTCVCPIAQATTGRPDVPYPRSFRPCHEPSFAARPRSGRNRRLRCP